MGTLREAFHEIANWHNKITLGAGSEREMLKDKPLYTMNEEELRAKHDRLIMLLDRFEKNAVEANKRVEALKDVIYGIVDADTGEPK